MSEGTALAARSEADIKLAEEDATGRRLRTVAVEDGKLVLHGSDGAYERVAAALGTDSRELQTYCVIKLMEILSEAASKEANDYSLPINTAVEMLAAIAPSNALEAMLAVQMVATHHLALIAARGSAQSDTREGRQINGNLATKFSRTFTMQLEALDRHRRGGKQIVEHVHVNAGGQAVIANTVNTGRAGGA